MLYGAGCRACSLVNFTGIGPFLTCAVDDQVEKQDRFIPGARLPIRPSSQLYDSGADLCLLAVNSENEDAVIRRHARFEAAGGTFASVHPPSSRLLPVWNEF